MWNLCSGANNCASRQQYTALQHEVLQMKFNKNNNDKHPSLLSAVCHLDLLCEKKKMPLHSFLKAFQSLLSPEGLC